MTTKFELLHVIRKHCLNCVSGSYCEVENCSSGLNASPYSECALWPYRLGKDPHEASDARKEQARKMREKKGMTKHQGNEKIFVSTEKLLSRQETGIKM